MLLSMRQSWGQEVGVVYYMTVLDRAEIIVLLVYATLHNFFSPT